MRILFYAKSPDATEVYRVQIPGRHLAKKPGIEIRMTYAEKHPKFPDSGVRNADIQWADAIVFQRPATELVLNVLKIIKNNHPEKIILLDYDDDYYSVPSWNPGYTFIRINEKFWPQFPSLVDGVITSTEPLAEVFRQKTDKPVTVIPNGFDFEEFDQTEPASDLFIENPGYDKKANKSYRNYSLNLAEFRAVQEDKHLITWAGSRFHFMDLEYIAEDVKKIIKERNDVNFMFVSYLQANVLKDAPPNRIYSTSGMSPVSRFYGLLKSLDSDIMLAPLDPCQFNRAKSNLKIMEAMALKAFPVCSRWDPYEDDLDPELNDDVTHGLLVGYERGDWYRAINEAMERIKDKSFKTVNDAYVRATHDASLRSDLYISFIESIKK